MLDAKGALQAAQLAGGGGSGGREAAKGLWAYLFTGGGADEDTPKNLVKKVWDVGALRPELMRVYTPLYGVAWELSGQEAFRRGFQKKVVEKSLR